MPRPSSHDERLPAVAQLGGAVSAQFGSAVGALGFPIAGPAPVAAVRQALAAVVFLVIARPPIHRMRWRQLWPALVLGIAVVIMNLSFYFAVQHLGLGYAVTLEFLGPLGVALAATRRAIDGGLAVAAFGGVILLSGTEGTVDVLGIVFALVAAGGWASYIVFSQVVGRRLPGLQGSAIAMTTAALFTLPMLVIVLIGLDPDARLRLLGAGALAGLLSTIIPQAIDMTVLRRMSRQVFGVLQSAAPALAALVGFILLGQTLGLWQIAGVAIISAANAVAVLTAGRRHIPVAVEPAVIESAVIELGAIQPRDDAPPTEPVAVVSASD